jgi:SAM-dependent methyltransferase
MWTEGEAYEAYMGRWGRPAAVEFLVWLALPEGLTWLDVGCGTGVLSEGILRYCAPAAVVGVDPCEGFLAHARAKVPDERAEFHAGDASALPVEDAACDAAVAGLALNFMPDPERALAEMVRTVRPGGTVAAYVWDYGHGMEMMRYFWDAAGDLDSAAAELDHSVRYPIANPIPMAALFAGAGLDEVETGMLDVPTVFRDFDDYWAPMLGGQGACPAYCMSLPDYHREMLRELLLARLPMHPDGTIRLTARAFAVRGAVPGAPA